MRYLPLLCLFFLSGTTLAQHPAPTDPLFETRAVWFMTLVGDGGWPERGLGDTPEKQAADLRARVQDAAERGINTFVFQAISNGNALYQSDRLPWSNLPTGPGIDPGYDPLRVVCEEARRLGMEVHAWVNVFEVGDLDTPDRFAEAPGPAHVIRAQPSWIVETNGQYWIDPADAEARAWLVGNMAELASQYAIDAVHFDFIRYPAGGLPTDSARFAAEPQGFADIGDWRRANVTRFVREAASAIQAEKPWVKLGAAPISNYRWFEGAWPAMWAYSDVFQESRLWLEEGLVDYLAPQLYWDLGTDPEPGDSLASPDFGHLVRDWTAHAADRPIFAGIGAFKDIVREEIGAQIDSARAAGASGQVFFRYDHLTGLDLADRYRHRTLPKPMTHRAEAAIPPIPADLILSETTGTVRLSWTPVSGTTTDPLRGYALFRQEGSPPDPTDPAHLLAVLGDTTAFTDVFTDTFDTPPSSPVFYRLVAVSMLGMTSAASDAVHTGQIVAVDTEAAPARFGIASVYPNPARTDLTAAYHLDGFAPVTVRVYDLLGREVVTRSLGMQPPGRGETRLPVGGLSGGFYVLSLEANGRRAIRRFVVMR